MSKTLLLVGFIGIGLTGCSSEKSDNGGAGGSTSGACDTNYDAIAANAPAVSLRNDLMPIFGLSCVAGECHNVYEAQPRAGLILGVKGAYDATSPPWLYGFPPDTGATLPIGDPIKDPQPITQSVLDTVRASLLEASLTVPSRKRVEPGNPSMSFLLDKVSDTQDEGPYQAECDNQDPTKSQAACGGPMPITGTALCLMPGSQTIQGAATGQDRFNAIVRWIAQGAQNN